MHHCFREKSLFMQSLMSMEMLLGDYSLSREHLPGVSQHNPSNLHTFFIVLFCSQAQCGYFAILSVGGRFIVVVLSFCYCGFILMFLSNFVFAFIGMCLCSEDTAILDMNYSSLMTSVNFFKGIARA